MEDFRIDMQNILLLLIALGIFYLIIRKIIKKPKDSKNNLGMGYEKQCGGVCKNMSCGECKKALDRAAFNQDREPYVYEAYLKSYRECCK